SVWADPAVDRPLALSARQRMPKRSATCWRKRPTSRPPKARSIRTAAGDSRFLYRSPEAETRLGAPDRRSSEVPAESPVEARDEHRVYVSALSARVQGRGRPGR